MVTLAKLMMLPLEAMFSGLAAVLEALTVPVTVAATLVGRLADALSRFVDRGIGDVRKLLGLPTMAGPSIGAAVRPASFTNVEDYQKQAFAKAFSLGTGANPAEKTAGYAASILQWLESRGDDLATSLKELPESLGNVIKQLLAEKLTPSMLGGGGGDKNTLGAAADVVGGVIPGGSVALAAARRVEDEILERLKRLRGS